MYIQIVPASLDDAWHELAYMTLLAYFFFAAQWVLAAATSARKRYMCSYRLQLIKARRTCAGLLGRN
jgi:hypothetical protein